MWKKPKKNEKNITWKIDSYRFMHRDSTANGDTIVLRNGKFLSVSYDYGDTKPGFWSLFIGNHYFLLFFRKFFRKLYFAIIKILRKILT